MAQPRAGDPGPVNWDGSELVAFKLHLPSKITFHNVRRLADNSPGEFERGNILTWEQRLADRRAGTPIDIQVHMERESILYRTLWLFGGSFRRGGGRAHRHHLVGTEDRENRVKAKGRRHKAQVRNELTNVICLYEKTRRLRS